MAEPKRAQGNRYVPRAMDDGHAWGVWDARECRFIPDAELETIPEDRLLYENVWEDA